MLKFQTPLPLSWLVPPRIHSSVGNCTFCSRAQFSHFSRLTKIAGISFQKTQQLNPPISRLTNITESIDSKRHNKCTMNSIAFTRERFYSSITSHSTGEELVRARAIKSRQKPGTTFGKNERIFVDHSYTDHSNEKPTMEEIQTLVNIRARNNFLSHRRTLFPIRLYGVLDMAAVTGIDGIISWQPHGRAFKIHNKKRFEKEVLLPILNMKSMGTFIKQMSLYGFRRLTMGSGADAGSYYHEQFLSGRDFLACRMTRETLKGRGQRAAAAPDKEPAFYKMPYCLCSQSDALYQDPLDNFIEDFLQDCDSCDEFGPQSHWCKSSSSMRADTFDNFSFEGIPFFPLEDEKDKRECGFEQRLSNAVMVL